MKLLSFAALLLFSFTSLAQTKGQQESTYLKVKSGEEVTTYEFHSIQDFEENSEKILDEISINNPTPKKEKPTNLTVEISITVNTDDGSTTITGSVAASPSTVIIEIKKLRIKLIAIVMG